LRKPIIVAFDAVASLKGALGEKIKMMNVSQE
jgi:hypothetical protein